MFETRIYGVLVRFQHAIDQDAVDNLSATLWLVPTQHMRMIRQIDVIAPARFGHGANYAGGGSGVGYPRLSELCFDRRLRPNNQPYNLTLLHEIGHVLEDTHHCLQNLSSEHRAVLSAIPIPVEGRTHGDGEHYAIAYQQVINGRASAAVRAAVLASRAFDGVDTVQVQ